MTDTNPSLLGFLNAPADTAARSVHTTPSAQAAPAGRYTLSTVESNRTNPDPHRNTRGTSALPARHVTACSGSGRSAAFARFLGEDEPRFAPSRTVRALTPSDALDLGNNPDWGCHCDVDNYEWTTYSQI